MSELVNACLMSSHESVLINYLRLLGDRPGGDVGIMPRSDTDTRPGEAGGAGYGGVRVTPQAGYRLTEVATDIGATEWVTVGFTINLLHFHLPLSDSIFPSIVSLHFQLHLQSPFSHPSAASIFRPIVNSICSLHFQFHFQLHLHIHFQLHLQSPFSHPHSASIFNSIFTSIFSLYFHLHL